MSFLEHLTVNDIENRAFPIVELLEDSLYYPCSAFDGEMVKDCNTNAQHLKIVSFIYCDYSLTIDQVSAKKNGFGRYHVLASRTVRHEEITPNGFTSKIKHKINPQDYQRRKYLWKPPFIHWAVYERNEDVSDVHGPKRFSHLYLGGEAVASYEALYWTHNKTAKVVAMIQSGSANGYTMNWSDFKDTDSPFYEVVMENPAGQPDWVYYGGGGECQYYISLNWPGFVKKRSISPYYDLLSRGNGCVIIYCKEKNNRQDIE